MRGWIFHLNEQSCIRLWPGPLGFSVSIVPSRLTAPSAAAFNRLTKALGEALGGDGEYEVNVMVNQLIIGRDSGENGLEALSSAWNAARASGKKLPPLSLKLFEDFARVIYNPVSFGSLRQLQALVGLVASRPDADPQDHAGLSLDRSIIHPDSDGPTVQDWINPLVQGLNQLRSVGTALRPGSTEKPAAYYQVLQAAQRAYDHRPVFGFQPLGGRPWSASTDPGFAETYALRAAFWRALALAGLTDQKLAAVRSREWSLDEVFKVVPALKDLDLAKAFPEALATLRPLVVQAMGEYDPIQIELKESIAAQQAANKFVSNPSLVSLLFDSFNNNRDLLISEWRVEQIVLDALAMGSGLTRPGQIEQLCDELKEKANAFVAWDKDRFPSVVAGADDARRHFNAANLSHVTPCRR
jgi:hypothetical protein